MAIAAKALLSPSTRHARKTPGNLFRRMSAQAMGMENAALCHRSHWVPKSSRSCCSNCHRNFHIWTSKHHCRLCGEVVCGTCSTKRILFQSKSVRTCDDCVDTNVQNISEINRRKSSPEFLRSNTIPPDFKNCNASEQRGLQALSLRHSSGDILHSHHSSVVASLTTRKSASSSRTGVNRSSNEDVASPFSKEMTVANYRVTHFWHAQVVLLIAALVVLIGYALMF